MFEDIYFQFPKLGFLFFVYLGCESLCPLRSNPIYFPRIAIFGEVGIKPPLWLWMAKWAMIIFFIIALMSPVKDHLIAVETGGMDVVIAMDPAAADQNTIAQIERFIQKRSEDRIGLWVPGKPETVIPLTREYGELVSILRQHEQGITDGTVTRRIDRFFADSQDSVKWVVVISNTPKTFVYSLPTGVQTSIVSPASDKGWVDRINSELPSHTIRPQEKYFDFYYLYPLFLGFLAMLVYLYGRNQKGLR